jgi:hypothetical protein
MNREMGETARKGGHDPDLYVTRFNR